MSQFEATAARPHDDDPPTRCRENLRSGDTLADESLLARVAWRVSDCALWAVLLTVPLMMGGAHPLGRLTYVGLVGLMTVAWLAYTALSKDRAWRFSGAEPVIALGFVVLIVQLAPLSAGLLGSLSPGMAELLPQWKTEGGIGLGTWSTVSFTPGATREAFIIYTAHVLFFLVLLQRLKTLADVQTMLRRVAIVGTGMAAFALVQYCTSNGKFVWIYQHPSRETNSRVVGSFANPNHFAHFLALAIGPILWCLILALGKRNRGKEKQSGFSTRQQPTARASFDAAGLKILWKNSEVFALSVALGICVLAALLSMSRGGIVALGIAMFTGVGLLALYQMVSRRTLIALVATGAIACLAVFLHGAEELQSEIDTLTAGSLESLDTNRGRRKIWAADAQVAAEFPYLGTGVGSHRDIYPVFFEDPETVEYLYAESGFMNLLVETGAAGMLVLAMSILLVCYWGAGALWRPTTPAHAACAAAVVGGIIASVLHSVVDFVWYIPACVMLTLVLLACLCRLHQSARRDAVETKPRSWSLPAWGWYAGALAMLLVATAMTWRMAPAASAAPHWESYLSMSLATNRYDRRAFEGSARSTYGKLDGNDEEVISTLLTNLNEALKRNPQDGRAHMRMASLCLRRFETEQQKAANAMALTHIRDAALASQFPSREALDNWLEAAIGENRRFLDLAQYHATRAVELRPLQGRAYVQLAELSFLDGPDASAKNRYIEQGLAVRPHDGAVLFAAGSEAIMAGQIELGIDYWRQAFHAGPEYQAIIIQNIASRVPPEFFLTTFEPDLQGQRLLFNHYRRHEMTEALECIGPQLAGQLEARAKELGDRSAAAFWFEAHGVQRQIGLYEAADYSGRQAVLLDSGDYEKRRVVAQWLLKREQYAEAAMHFRWCLHRRPDDSALQQQLREAIKESTASTAASPSRLSQAILGDDVDDESETTTQ